MKREVSVWLKIRGVLVSFKNSLREVNVICPRIFNIDFFLGYYYGCDISNWCSKLYKLMLERWYLTNKEICVANYMTQRHLVYGRGLPLTILVFIFIFIFIFMGFANLNQQKTQRSKLAKICIFIWTKIPFIFFFG